MSINDGAPVDLDFDPLLQLPFCPVVEVANQRLKRRYPAPSRVTSQGVPAYDYQCQSTFLFKAAQCPRDLSPKALGESIPRKGQGGYGAFQLCPQPK